MKKIVKSCKDCNTTFILTANDQKKYLDRGHALPERCEMCRAKRRQTIHLVCINCGEPFSMSERDAAFYEAQGFQQPKHCLECRNKRRTQRNHLERGCKASTFDPDSGRWNCAVSGDGCMYMIPDSKRCAEEYGEGPDANDYDTKNILIAKSPALKKLIGELVLDSKVGGKS